MLKRIAFVTFLGMCLFFNPSAYAHSVNHGSGFGGSGRESQCPVAGKILMKTGFLLKNQSDLGLSAEQVKAIQDIKLQTEKDGIKLGADREIFMLDLKSKLEEDKIDVDGVNALIDKGFSSAAAATKANVETYAKLKSTLTPEQSTKMKELFKNKKEQWKNKD